VYDVTDDWLAAPFPPREIERLRRLEELALERASAVVVCSQALASTRGRRRPVVSVPNGVDAEHFRRPHLRPEDLPASPVAVYVGTLHESRLDVDLAADLARTIRALTVILVGPDSLGPSARRRLDAEPNIRLLGARAYRDVPGYLQHADVVVVPHRVSAFTDSLDPIKAYECVAAGRPTVATPVAGFRDLGPPVVVVQRDGFVDAVRSALASPGADGPAQTPPSWDERAREFERVLIGLRRTDPS
jgi:glycosyltransferase involved in cell wall biosynthesis